MITLRELQVCDLQTRVNWMNDERINATLNIQLPITLESTQAWFERIQSNDTRADLTFIEDGEIVAMGGFTNIDRSVNKAELYIFVHPDMKGRGIGTQSVRLMCEYGFKDVGLNKIYLHTNSDNLSACRLYEKVGFILEGIHEQEIINNGKIKDRFYYGLLNSKRGG